MFGIILPLGMFSVLFVIYFYKQRNATFTFVRSDILSLRLTKWFPWTFFDVIFDDDDDGGAGTSWVHNTPIDIKSKMIFKYLSQRTKSRNLIRWDKYKSKQSRYGDGKS